MTTVLAFLSQDQLDGLLLFSVAPVVYGIVRYIARVVARKTKEQVVEVVEPMVAAVHKRIDDHMITEETQTTNLVANQEWLAGAVTALAGSLGVQLDGRAPSQRK